MEVTASDIALALSIVGTASTLWRRQSVSNKGHLDEVRSVTRWRTETDADIKQTKEDVKRAEREHKEDVERMEREHKEDVKRMEREHKEDVERMEREREKVIELLFAKLKEITTLLTAHCTQCAADKATHAEKLDGVNTQLLEVKGDIMRLHTK